MSSPKTDARPNFDGYLAIGLLALLWALVVILYLIKKFTLETAVFAGLLSLVAILFGLSLEDTIAEFKKQLRQRKRGDPESAHPRTFNIQQPWVQRYARSLSPLGFVLGVILGHYFWH